MQPLGTACHRWPDSPLTRTARHPYLVGAGQSVMDFQAFFDCMFECADMWVDSIDGLDYARFLQLMLGRGTAPSVDQSGVGRHGPEERLAEPA